MQLGIPKDNAALILITENRLLPSTSQSHWKWHLSSLQQRVPFNIFIPVSQTCRLHSLFTIYIHSPWNGTRIGRDEVEHSLSDQGKQFEVHKNLVPRRNSCGRFSAPQEHLHNHPRTVHGWNQNSFLALKSKLMQKTLIYVSCRHRIS